MNNKSLEKITFPVRINKHKWILLNRLGSKVFIRATSIGKIKRVKDESDHRVDEMLAEAEGGVKVRSKLYDISKF